MKKKWKKSYDPIRVRVKSPVLDGQGLTFIIHIQCWQQVLKLVTQATWHLSKWNLLKKSKHWLTWTDLDSLKPTPWKFNTSPLKIGRTPRRKAFFQASFFRGYVRGCTSTNTFNKSKIVCVCVWKSSYVGKAIEMDLEKHNFPSSVQSRWMMGLFFHSLVALNAFAMSLLFSCGPCFLFQADSPQIINARLLKSPLIG